MRVNSSTVLAVCLGATLSARGLIMVGTGNKPVTDPGWPSGAIEVANLPQRIGWWEGPPFGGGEWHFEFIGDTRSFEQTLEAFAKIKAPALDLFLHDGTQNSFVLDPNHKTASNNVDWTFTVWVPKNWNNLYGPGKQALFSDDPNFGKSMPPPRIDLYLGPDSKIVFDRSRLASTIQVRDQRASAAGVDTSRGTVLRATIADAQTHRPIEGARLRITARDERNQFAKELTPATTTAQGIAQIDGLPAGVYRLSAVADGYVEAALAYEDFPANIFQEFAVELARSVSVSGRAVDEQGRGVAGLRVIAANTLLATNVPYRTLEKPVTSTDVSGNFTLENLPAGLVQIWIQSTNYFHTNIFNFYPAPGNEVLLHVQRCGALRVRVEDTSGNAIVRLNDRTIQVSVEPVGGSVVGSWGGSADVQADGTCFFAGAHPGSYVISVLSSKQKISALIAPGQTTEVHLQLP
jgi:hypothetical protein